MLRCCDGKWTKRIWTLGDFESGRRHELGWLDESPGLLVLGGSAETTCSANHDTGTIASPNYILSVPTVNVNDTWQNLLNVAVQHTQ